MRTADKPGSFRIKQSGGEWKLSGVTQQGRRVRLAFNSEIAAKRTADTLFPSRRSQDMPISTTAPVLDDWGLPSQVPGLPTIDVNVAGAVNGAMGINPQPDVAAEETIPLPEPEEDPETKKKREQSVARAKSLCEFFGIAYAAGVAQGAKKICVVAHREPVNPSAKAVGELGKAATTAFQELVGDWEVGPWTMLLLLTFAMPLSMLLQSRPLPKKVEGASSDSQTSSHSSEGLKAV